MREGSLEAPVRHPIAWQEPDFTDPEKIDAELRRVFDICHGCRRCFNLCDSFPRLFDLVDAAPSEELDTVESKDFKAVVDACTLCDMCFLTKCPYVPPHDFNLDFPHLMLRYRAMELAQGKVSAIDQQLTKTDRNGRLAAPVAPLANWASSTKNGLTRPILEAVAKVDRHAELPPYQSKPFDKRFAATPPQANQTAPGYGRKVALFTTCFANYNNPAIGEAAVAVLAHNGVDVELAYPGCCGMPQLEHGDLKAVAEKARTIAATLRPLIEDGRDVVALVPSCALMLKFEWPLILPDDENVKILSRATFDVPEYIVDIARKSGLAQGLRPLSTPVALHIACHARAQNMGQKATEMLRLIPEIDLTVIERCSGHGGTWGIKKGNFDIALKIGKPVARKAAEVEGGAVVASECPLACTHIAQGLEALDQPRPATHHPIELFAQAFGLVPEGVP